MILLQYYHQRNQQKTYDDTNYLNQSRNLFDWKMKEICKSTTLTFISEILTRIRFLKYLITTDIATKILSQSKKTLMMQLIYTFCNDENVALNIFPISDLEKATSVYAYDSFLNQISDPVVKAKINVLFNFFKQNEIPPSESINYLYTTYVNKQIDEKWKILITSNFDEAFYNLLYRFLNPTYPRYLDLLREKLAVFLNNIIRIRYPYSQLECNLLMYLDLRNNQNNLLQSLQTQGIAIEKAKKFLTYFYQLCAADTFIEVENEVYPNYTINFNLLKRYYENQIIAATQLVNTNSIVKINSDEIDITSIINQILNSNKCDASFYAFFKILSQINLNRNSYVNVVYHTCKLHDSLFNTDFVNTYFPKEKVKIIQQAKSYNFKLIDLSFLHKQTIENPFRSKIEFVYNEVLKTIVYKIIKILNSVFDEICKVLQDESNIDLMRQLQTDYNLFYKTMLTSILKERLLQILFNCNFILEILALIDEGKIDPLINSIYQKTFQQLLTEIEVETTFQKLIDHLKLFGNTIEGIDLAQIFVAKFKQLLSESLSSIVYDTEKLFRKLFVDYLVEIDKQIDNYITFACMPPYLLINHLVNLIVLFMLEPIQIQVLDNKTLDTFAYNLYTENLHKYLSDIMEKLL